MKTARPIEIIGGGLAGLTLGLALRRRDVPVVLYDAGHYPRHRVCGEFITGLDDATIETLGVRPFLSDARLHREVAWYIGDRRTHNQRLPAPALGISRHILDWRLAEAFKSAGGELRCGARVADATAPRPGRVLASGRHRGKPTWIGLKVHVRRLALARDLELHLGDNAYVGLSGVENDTVNVCGLFKQRTVAENLISSDAGSRANPGEQIRPDRTAHQLLFAYLESCGLTRLAARLRQAEIEVATFCAVAALEFGPAPAVRNGISIGDACAMPPPFTGNGMAMALQSAAIATEPLLAYVHGEKSWEDACDQTQQALRRRFRLRLASAEQVHPFLLGPRRQRLLAALSRLRLLPFRPLYAMLH